MMLSKSPLTNFMAAIGSICIGIPASIWMLPVSWYFEATVEVPDHVQGEDPVVKYIRTIKRTQRMSFLVEIRSADHKRGKQFCSGGGESLYVEDEALALPLPLSRYTGSAKCDLPPGLFIMDTCWSYNVLVFDKTYCARSNVFKVTKS